MNRTIKSNIKICIICHGNEYYKDNQGIWHPCPKCPGIKISHKYERIDKYHGSSFCCPLAYHKRDSFSISCECGCHD